jgi:diacylglycerol kinase (ATP)
MRAAAILGPGNVSKAVAEFQRATDVQWTSLIEQADAVVIFGGDGTIHHQLCTLLDLAVPLLVVPCGSGNDFARSLGLRKIADSIAAWKEFSANGHSPKDIDLGLISGSRGHQLNRTDGASVDGTVEAVRSPFVNSGKPAEHGAISRYFCCVAGIGLDSQINKRANRLPRWIRAHGGYALTATREFLRFAPFPMKISNNGNAAAAFRPTMLAAVANAPSYGGGMRIAPRAKLDDGKLDLCTVRRMDTLKLFCLFPTIFFGRHLGFQEVEYEQAESLRIETEYPRDVYADGEFVCQTPVEFSVARKALKVIIP